MIHFDRHASACRLTARGSIGLLAIAVLAACGGGGGGSSESTQQSPSSASPTLSISADATSTSSAGAPIGVHAAESNGTGALTWTLTGPGSLSATTGAEVTYLPPDAESLAQAATAIVTASADGISKQVTISVAVGHIAGQHWDLRHSTASGSPDGHLIAADIVGGRLTAVSTSGNFLSIADGTSWSETSLGAAAWPASPKSFSASAMASLASGRQVVAGFVPAGNGGVAPAVLYTDDGVAWKTASEPQDMFANILLDDGTRFLALANGGVYASPDGSAWSLLSRITVQSGQWVHGAAKGPGLYVAVGQGGLAATSPDAIHWTLAPIVLDAGSSTAPLDLTGVVYAGDRFVAVADNGHVATSPDGQHWRVNASATTAALASIAVSSQGELVAVGDQGTIETSLDAVHWTLRSGVGAAAVHDVVFAGGTFLLAGDDGAIATSTH